MLGNLQQIILPPVFLRMALGDTLRLVGEKKVALSFSWSFKICLANLHASPRVPSLLSFSLFLRPILKFHSAGTALMRNFDLNFFRATDLCFLGCMTLRCLCESHSSSGSQDFCVLPQNRKRFWRLCIQKNANQLSYIFQYSHLTFVTIFFLFFAGFDLHPACVQVGTCHRIHIPIQICRIDIREDANNHKVIWCTYFSSSLCTAVERTS